MYQGVWFACAGRVEPELPHVAVMFTRRMGIPWSCHEERATEGIRWPTGEGQEPEQRKG